MFKVLQMLFVLLFSFSVYAEPIANPLLWKAEKNGQVAYIFGTFHLGFSMTDLPATFTQYVDSSKSFYMEADLSVVTQEKMIARAIFPQGQSLDQYLPKESWDKLTALTATVMPADQLKQFKPWYVSAMLVGQLAMQQVGLKGTLDLELLQYAGAKSITKGYLEDTYLQFSVLESIFPVNVLDMQLKESNNLIEDSKNELLKIYGCYQISDVSCLTTMLGTKAQGGTMDEWQVDLMLKQRNKTWIPVIQKAVTGGQTFIAVGAGHLVGDGNVLDLLQAEGFQINRVQF